MKQEIGQRIIKLETEYEECDHDYYCSVKRGQRACDKLERLVETQEYKKLKDYKITKVRQFDFSKIHTTCWVLVDIKKI